MVLLTNLESFTLTISVVSLTSLEFTRGTASKMNSIAALLPKIAFPPDTLAVNTIDQFDLLSAGRSPSPKLNSIAARLPKMSFSLLALRSIRKNPKFPPLTGPEC
ncbi:hypothetical protein TNCV_34201 [Trichonephila clavipes]|nr:hypothetical protein TNCV_34201 [Trichonephila clavipes]